MIKHRYFYLKADHHAEKGFDKGVSVYKMTNEYPTFIGLNYRLHSSVFMGYKEEARVIIAENTHHKLPDPYSDFPAQSVTLRDINGN